MYSDCKRLHTDRIRLNTHIDWEGAGDDTASGRQTALEEEVEILGRVNTEVQAE